MLFFAQRGSLDPANGPATRSSRRYETRWIANQILLLAEQERAGCIQVDTRSTLKAPRATRRSVESSSLSDPSAKLPDAILEIRHHGTWECPQAQHAARTAPVRPPDFRPNPNSSLTTCQPAGVSLRSGGVSFVDESPSNRISRFLCRQAGVSILRLRVRR